jgi:hypothetical protein
MVPLHVPRSAQRLIALLLALSLQFQALAAAVMPCAHAQPGTQAVQTGCRHTASERSDLDAKGYFSCAKCVLAAMASAYHPPPVPGPAATAPPRPVLSASLPAHFYHFVPPPLRRPPTAALAW